VRGWPPKSSSTRFIHHLFLRAGLDHAVVTRSLAAHGRGFFGAEAELHRHLTFRDPPAPGQILAAATAAATRRLFSSAHPFLPAMASSFGTASFTVSPAQNHPARNPHVSSA